MTVTNLTSASGDSPVSWRTIPTGEESVYKAQESIVLKDGFVVERGADFAAIITPCDNCGNNVLTESRNAPASSSTSENTEEMGDPFPRQEESAAFLEDGVVEGVDAKEPFTLMPNPASGEVRIVTEGEGFEGGTLTVSDATGREVQRKELARGTRKCVLDVSGLPSGTYFVTLTTAKGTSTQKLVVEN